MNSTALNNMKFRITSPEQSERLQKILFELGYKWSTNGTSIEHTSCPYIYTEENGCITYCNDLWFYDQADKFVKVDAEAFIEKYTSITVAENVLPTIDKHYSFDYKLTEDDIKKGSIKIDPYFVSQQWQLGAKDNTSVIFHCLKTLARFGVKNSKEREITALYKQIKRLAELEGITLG